MNLQVLLDRAVELHRKGDIGQAEALYRQLLQASPHPGLLYLLGVLCDQSGRRTEALKNFDEALALQPDHFDALCGRGDVLQELGQPGEALRSYDKAIALRPDRAEVFFNRGNILLGMKRFTDAAKNYDRAVSLQPDFADAYTNRGVARLELKQFDDALADFDLVAAMAPGDAEAHYNRSRALAELYRFDEAMACLDKALAIRPDHIGALGNRGVVLWNMERFEDALTSYDQTLAIAPHLAVIVTNRANTLKDMMRLDESLACHDRAIAMAPDHPSVHWNKSLTLLLTGRFAEGLALFEWRKKLAEWKSFPLRNREWLGQEDIAGKTLFVLAEQGLGDTLQFCRYVFAAQARGAAVILGVQEPLIRLMKSLTPAVDICSWTDPPKHFDYYIPLMSMPLAFGTEPDTIPSCAAYLQAEPDRVAYWAKRLGPAGFKIGISWRGGGRGLEDVGRSFRLRKLEMLGQIPGVRLISLQKIVGVEELSDLPPGMRVETLGEDFDGDGAFLDSAAVMQNMDLVISSDTAVAHLAGALGRPAWLATQYVPDWRWLLGRTDTPWYPSMRLFRQQKPGDWAGVFAQMSAQLAEMIAPP